VRMSSMFCAALFVSQILIMFFYFMFFIIIFLCNAGFGEAPVVP
jgi:hypothetical protein